MPSHPKLRALLAGLCLAAFAAPALAYTIFLKDGKQILARSKYVVQGDQAIITLPSGTRSSYPLSDIDVARTEAANQQDLGTAVEIPTGPARGFPTPTPAPQRQSLQDLIRSQQAGVREPPKPEVRRPPVGTEPTRSLRPDASGRAPYRDLELANDLQAELITRGAAGDVYQGSTGSRVRVEIETRSEGAVFKALLAAAHGLLMVRERFPGKVEALELRCVVPEDGSLAGRFTLSPVVAADLTAGRIDLTRFYVENVEF
jgi:hypothetical protein